MVKIQDQTTSSKAKKPTARKSLLRYPLRNTLPSATNATQKSSNSVSTKIVRAPTCDPYRRQASSKKRPSVIVTVPETPPSSTDPYSDASLTNNTINIVSPKVSDCGSDNETPRSPGTVTVESPADNLNTNHDSQEGNEEAQEETQEDDNSEHKNKHESDTEAPFRPEYPTVQETLNEDFQGFCSIPDPERNLKAYYASRDPFTRAELVPHRWKIVVNTIEGLLEFLDEANKVSAGAAELFLDEEGNNHGKDGVLCTIQVTFASMTGLTFILDVVALGKELFSTVGAGGRSLKDILEDPHIFKSLFDIRNDSAALFHQYGVKLEGTVDLQIMELAVRGTAERLLGLQTCINRYLNLNEKEMRACWEMKSGGQDYCRGDYSKWEERPMPPVMLDYAANDTVYMPHLYAAFFNYLQNDPEKLHKVMVESARRVQESQQLDFVSGGSWAPSAFQPDYSDSDLDIY